MTAADHGTVTLSTFDEQSKPVERSSNRSRIVVCNHRVTSMYATASHAADRHMSCRHTSGPILKINSRTSGMGIRSLRRTSLAASFIDPRRTTKANNWRRLRRSAYTYDRCGWSDRPSPARPTGCRRPSTGGIELAGAVVSAPRPSRDFACLPFIVVRHMG